MDTAMQKPVSPPPSTPASSLMASATQTATISPSQLRGLLQSPNPPLVLDVRRAPKFTASQRLLYGAQWCAPEDVAAFAKAQTPRTALVYCVYGHNVSEDAVATLRAAGWDASALAGGIEGGEGGVDALQNTTLWRAQGLPTFTKRADWGVDGTQASRWITRERPKIDRVACPWLIRRFIDPRAEFFYVPSLQVFPEAARLGAVAYDIPGAPVSHVGELCSFDALIGGFELRDPALELLATIVRGADTDQLTLAPQSAGLLAVSLGLSSLHHADDQAMLAAAMPLYDALYAWCVAMSQGHAEAHNWNPSLKAAA
jgi:rhodanese-related sulfurtransferase